MATEEKTGTLTSKERQQERHKTAQQLGVVMLPTTILLLGRRASKVTEEEVEAAFLRSMGEEYANMVTMFQYNVHEEYYSHVIRGQPYEGSPGTEELVLVDIWYYFHIVPVYFSK